MDKKAINLKQITKESIKQYLKENGFDGLYAGNFCGCTLDNLMKGEYCDIGCTPGYRKIGCDKCGDCDQIGPEGSECPYEEDPFLGV